MGLSRRQFFAITTPALALGQAPQSRGLKIVCVGAHPDDPESMCGGTLARYIAQVHAVTLMYLTRGEAGIPGKSHDEAAAIRSAECAAACKILGAKAVFAGQIDGATVVDAKAVESFSGLLSAERPNVVFTHWPIDAHLDHQAASTLTFRAWLAARRSFELYYGEANLGSQTMGFHPTDYVDITPFREKKKVALFAHVSQDPMGFYRQYHEVMESFRGREYGVTAAEAFVHLARGSGAASLLGLGL